MHLLLVTRTLLGSPSLGRFSAVFRLRWWVTYESSVPFTETTEDTHLAKLLGGWMCSFSSCIPTHTRTSILVKKPKRTAVKNRGTFLSRVRWLIGAHLCWRSSHRGLAAEGLKSGAILTGDLALLGFSKDGVNKCCTNKDLFYL